MAARTPTLRSQVEALTAVVAALAERIPAQAPAQGAPAQATAKAPSTFYTDVIASRKPCAIPAHKGICNRRFSKNSSGDVNHLARLD